MKNASFTISLVVPFNNEESNIDRFFDSVYPIIDLMGYDVEIICINDGSSDSYFKSIIQKNKKVIGRSSIIDFTRNFGKESAVSAGLHHSSAMPCDS